VDNLTPDQHQFIARLRSVGGSAGNSSLRARLAWSEDKYFTVQCRLVDMELIQRGKGRGGSVILVESGDTEPAVEVFSERALYAPVARALPRWIRQHYGPQSFVWLTTEVVGSKGGARLGGSWRRTDLAGVSVRAFEYSPDVAVDTFAFEVKTIANLDVAAIYETSENSSGATYGYLLVHRSVRHERDRQGALFLRLERAATMTGIGIVSFEQPDAVDTWDCELEAVRRPHDPAASDAFIRRTFSDHVRIDLSDRIRTADGPKAFRTRTTEAEYLKHA
jgi:hypothetical protein